MSNIKSGLLNLSVLVIPFIINPAGLDPALPVRIFAWGLLTVILITILAIKTNADFSILRCFIFPLSALYLLISLLSLLRAVNVMEGLFVCARVLLFFSFLYAACLILNGDQHRIKSTTRSVILCATVLALMGLGQFTGMLFTGIPGHYRIYATLINKNMLAQSLFLSLPFVCWGIFSFKGAWLVFARICLGLIFIVLLMIANRAVGGACFLFMVVGLGLAKKLRWSVLLWILSISVITLWQPFWTDNSFKKRISLWKPTLKMIADAPITGVGAGQWKIMFACYDPQGNQRHGEQKDEIIIYQRAHNDHLQILAETGVPGLLCHLSLFGIIIIYGCKVIKKVDHETRTFLILMISAICGYMLIACFSFPGERVVNNILLILSMAGIISVYHHSGTPVKPALMTGVHIFLLVGLAGLMLFSGVRIKSDINLKTALQARSLGQWNIVIDQIKLAQSWAYPLDPFVTPLSFYSASAYAALGNLQAAQRNFTRSLKINPCIERNFKCKKHRR